MSLLGTCFECPMDSRWSSSTSSYARLQYLRLLVRKPGTQVIWNIVLKEPCKRQVSLPLFLGGGASGHASTGRMSGAVDWAGGDATGARCTSHFACNAFDGAGGGRSWRRTHSSSFSMLMISAGNICLSREPLVVMGEALKATDGGKRSPGKKHSYVLCLLGRSRIFSFYFEAAVRHMPRFWKGPRHSCCWKTMGLGWVPVFKVLSWCWRTHRKRQARVPPPPVFGSRGS